MFAKKVGLGAEGRLSAEFFRRLLRSDAALYYCSPELNETLYLHYLGAEQIEALEPFTELRVLYLEGNALRRIEGLGAQARLRCLCLQENLIERVEGLGAQRELLSLNLSDNLIARVEGLQCLPALESLQLRRNRLGVNGLDDLRGLLCCARLSSLDLAANRVDADPPEEFLALLERLPALAVLYLQPNPVCARIPHYRKTLVARLKALKYLDDRPVFAEERRFAEAFRAGGAEAELEERRKHREEERESHLRQHLAFKAMLEGAAAPEQPPDEDSQHSSQLDTYASGESALSAGPPCAAEEEAAARDLLDELD